MPQSFHARKLFDYEHEHRPRRRTEHEHDGIPSTMGQNVDYPIYSVLGRVLSSQDGRNAFSVTRFHLEDKNFGASMC
jgi:hypothetical protein